MKDVPKSTNNSFYADFRLRKAERLSRKKAFEYLFEKGRSFKSGVLKFYFVFDPPLYLTEAPASIAISAPKRSFKKAVHRNLLKRRIREAYRLNKSPLIQLLNDRKQHLLILVKYQRPFIASFHTINECMIAGLGRLADISAKIAHNYH